MGVTNSAGGVLSPQAVLTVVDPAATLGPTFFTNNVFGFTVNGLSNRVYALEVSTNLVDWTQVAVNTVSLPVVAAGQPSTSENRFYRAVYTHERLP